MTDPHPLRLRVDDVTVTVTGADPLLAAALRDAAGPPPHLGAASTLTVAVPAPGATPSPGADLVVPQGPRCAWWADCRGEHHEDGPPGRRTAGEVADAVLRTVAAALADGSAPRRAA